MYNHVLLVAIIMRVSVLEMQDQPEEDPAAADDNVSADSSSITLGWLLLVLVWALGIFVLVIFASVLYALFSMATAETFTTSFL